jgi:hypothetical protein
MSFSWEVDIQSESKPLPEYYSGLYLILSAFQETQKTNCRLSITIFAISKFAILFILMFDKLPKLKLTNKPFKILILYQINFASSFRIKSIITQYDNMTYKFSHKTKLNYF